MSFIARSAETREWNWPTTELMYFEPVYSGIGKFTWIVKLLSCIRAPNDTAKKSELLQFL